LPKRTKGVYPRYHLNSSRQY